MLCESKSSLQRVKSLWPLPVLMRLSNYGPCWHSLPQHFPKDTVMLIYTLAHARQDTEN